SMTVSLLCEWIDYNQHTKNIQLNRPNKNACLKTVVSDRHLFGGKINMVNQLKIVHSSYSGLIRISPNITGTQDTRVKSEYDGVVII
ncbi:hypothetical protein ACTHS7_10660, partial [Neisseria sp. P0015.S009]|uniref:hypothetical protein n=1 Tax=Neisseria sp. P0015.S009 TaxID=3436765 RepID=UPI003F813953